MRACYITQYSVFGFGVVQGDPTGHIVGGHALLRLVILVPEYGFSMPVWLAQNKIVELAVHGVSSSLLQRLKCVDYTAVR